MRTYKGMLTLAIAAVLASTAFGAAAKAEEPSSWADDFVVASLAAEAGISREEAARRLGNQEAQAILAERLAEQLGERAAGHYLDRRTGDLIVNVLDDRAADEVRAAGATPRTVRYSTAELESVSSQLDRDGEAGHAGHVVSIGTDHEANAVVVTIPASAQADAARFIEQVRSFGGRTRIEISRDPLPELNAFNIYAGPHQISTAGGWCTSGFAAKDASNYRYMLTAQHCVKGNNFNVNMFGQFFGQRWYQNASYDTASILNWNPANMNQLPNVWQWNGGSVTVKGQYTTGQNWYICKSGLTTFWTCGYVEATGQKVWMANGGLYVYNLTKAGVCSKGGDSGGPVVVKAGFLGYWYATGILSAGNTIGACTASSKMYYVPVVHALAATGLSLVTG